MKHSERPGNLTARSFAIAEIEELNRRVELARAMQIFFAVQE